MKNVYSINSVRCLETYNENGSKNNDWIIKVVEMHNHTDFNDWVIKECISNIKKLYNIYNLLN